VLNFGIPGLNLDDKIEQYTAFASRWSPDLVLYIAVTRDIHRPFCGDLWGRNVVPRGIIYWINKSYLTRTIYILLHYWLEPWKLTLTPEQADARIKDGIKSFARAAQRNGSEFGMVMISNPLGWSAGEGLRQWGESVGIRILDLSPVVTEAQNRIPRDGHLSARGNHLVAEAIHTWLHSYEPQ
jgi:hypothetical protein